MTSPLGAMANFYTGLYVGQTPKDCESPPEERRKAARFLAAHAKDEKDLELLLDILGLHEEEATGEDPDGGSD